MVHIKEPLLLIGKSNPSGGSGFPLSLFEWSVTICVTPYNRKYNVLSVSLNKTLVFQEDVDQVGSVWMYLIMFCWQGDLVKSSVTGRMEPHYPAWKRQLFRYCVSVPVTSLGLAVVFVVMLLVFELQEWVNAHIAQNDIPSFLRFIPKILLALSIGFLDEGYKKIAIWLNKKGKFPIS